MSEDNDIPELTDAKKMRWQVIISDMRKMSAALRDHTMSLISGTIDQ
jgi:hypothetical protein